MLKLFQALKSAVVRRGKVVVSVEPSPPPAEGAAAGLGDLVPSAVKSSLAAALEGRSRSELIFFGSVFLCVVLFAFLKLYERRPTSEKDEVEEEEVVSCPTSPRWMRKEESVVPAKEETDEVSEAATSLTRASSGSGTDESEGEDREREEDATAPAPVEDAAEEAAEDEIADAEKDRAVISPDAVPEEAIEVEAEAEVAEVAEENNATVQESEERDVSSDFDFIVGDVEPETPTPSGAEDAAAAATPAAERDATEPVPPSDMAEEAPEVEEEEEKKDDEEGEMARLRRAQSYHEFVTFLKSESPGAGSDQGSVVAPVDVVEVRGGGGGGRAQERRPSAARKGGGVGGFKKTLSSQNLKNLMKRRPSSRA